MRPHLAQFLSRKCQQFTRASPRLVPAFEHAVDHLTLPRSGRLGIELVEHLKPQDRPSIKLVRIAAQPVERGD